jgi:hypothetical protein
MKKIFSKEEVTKFRNKTIGQSLNDALLRVTKEDKQKHSDMLEQVSQEDKKDTFHLFLLLVVLFILYCIFSNTEILRFVFI